MENIKYYWNEFKVIIIPLACLLILSFGSCSIKGCVDNYRYGKEVVQRQEEQRKVDSAEAQRQSVTENEKYKYPKIDDNITSIEKANEALKKQLKSLKDVNKKDIEDETKNYDATAITKSFNELGYAAKVISQ